MATALPSGELCASSLAALQLLLGRRAPSLLGVEKAAKEKVERLESCNRAGTEVFAVRVPPCLGATAPRWRALGRSSEGT